MKDLMSAILSGEEDLKMIEFGYALP